MAVLTARQIGSYCYSAGFRGNALVTAIAVALGESGGNTAVINRLGCTGLFQIYIKVHIKANPSWTTKAMQQPYNNCKAAYQLSKGGKNWKPWEAYTNGRYKKFLSAARSAAQQTEAAKGSGGIATTTSAKIPPPTGITVAKVLQIAAKEIGYRERSNNRTKYHTDMGLGMGQPWCACFTSWVLWKAGFSKTTLKKLLGANLFHVFSQRDHSKKIRSWTTTAKPGYLAVFSFSHIEIVEKVISKNTIQTIGGNTSSGNRGSQNNGDGVWRRTRSTKQVQGYIKIPYDSGLAGAGTHFTGMDPVSQLEQPPLPDIDKNGFLNENGVWNPSTAVEFAKFAKITLPIKSSVAYWREFEREANFPVKYQNGVLDHETIQYLQWFTHQSKLTGIWDSATIRGVQRHINKVKQDAIDKAKAEADERAAAQIP